eukprot:scaffold5296_cov163-Amphora_coffeaeformis.AAC.17
MITEVARDIIWRELEDLFGRTWVCDVFGFSTTVLYGTRTGMVWYWHNTRNEPVWRPTMADDRQIAAHKEEEETSSCFRMP